MPSKKTHDVVATVGSYKDAQGAEKKRYVNCGSAFTDENGRVSIKLDTVPVSPEWSGWLSLYEPKEKEGGHPQARQSQRTAQRQPNLPPADQQPLEEDDIPF